MLWPGPGSIASMVVKFAAGLVALYGLYLFATAGAAATGLQCQQTMDEAITTVTQSPDLDDRARKTILEAPPESIACRKTTAVARTVGILARQ